MTIRPVCGSHDRKAFVSVAREIYPNDSPWLRPLDMVVRGHLDQKRNPIYQDATGQAFLALDGERVIGRILAIVWSRHEKLHGERVGYFGLFECIENETAARMLFDAAIAFVRDLGASVLRGPFNITAAQEVGIVTEGFAQSPSIDMTYTPALVCTIDRIQRIQTMSSHANLAQSQCFRSRSNGDVAQAASGNSPTAWTDSPAAGSAQTRP